MGSLVDITLVNRWNVGRVSDAVLFMLGNCGLRSLVSMLDALPMVVLVSRLLLSGVIYPARNSVATYKPVAAAVNPRHMCWVFKRHLPRRAKESHVFSKDSEVYYTK